MPTKKTRTHAYRANRTPPKNRKANQPPTMGKKNPKMGFRKSQWNSNRRLKESSPFQKHLWFLFLKKEGQRMRILPKRLKKRLCDKPDLSPLFSFMEAIRIKLQTPETLTD